MRETMNARPSLRRGVTIDVCVKHFTTKSRQFTILDAPGHRDFVPNMVHGAVQADVAILVVDVSHFEASSIFSGAQQSLTEIRALGISNVVVAVNKLDTCDWDQQVFEETKRRVNDYMTGPEVGFKQSGINFVPLSGFSGENMLERKEPKLSWWTGPTLVEALDQLPPPPRPSSTAPLRLCVSDVYRSGATLDRLIGRESASAGLFNLWTGQTGRSSHFIVLCVCKDALRFQY
eukprot:Skav230292  [mRNA]  locus=scaffold2934:106323:110552:- [translate_table: standard]